MGHGFHGELLVITRLGNRVTLNPKPLDLGLSPVSPEDESKARSAAMDLPPSSSWAVPMTVMGPPQRGARRGALVSRPWKKARIRRRSMNAYVNLCEYHGIIIEYIIIYWNILEYHGWIVPRSAMAITQCEFSTSYSRDEWVSSIRRESYWIILNIYIYICVCVWFLYICILYIYTLHTSYILIL